MKALEDMTYEELFDFLEEDDNEEPWDDETIKDWEEKMEDC